MAGGFEVRGARVLITGATGGLGRAIALILRDQGAQLILTGRRGDVLETLAAETGGEVIPADLETAEGVNALVEAAGPVDVLVANAGIPASGRVLEYTPEQLERAVAVNLVAPMLLARACAPAMVDAGRGRLVFVSSLAGKAASPGTAVYSATKFGLRGFALGLREDLMGTGVGVTAIFPGFIADAGMFADSNARLPAFAGVRRPDDVARAVVRAIEGEYAELDVAPLTLRVGAALAGLAPRPINALQRRLGSRAVSDRVADGQRDKR